MPDVREVFEMIKQQTQPDTDSWAEQERRLARASRNRKVGALALVAALVVGAALLVVSNLAGQESSVPASPGSSSATAPRTPVHEDPGLSPDGTTIALLRDPYDPHIKDAAPYVLQVWLQNADGSGQRKLWQHPGCCIAAYPDLRWSKDGSSIILTGVLSRTIDVATGESLPTPSPTG